MQAKSILLLFFGLFTFLLTACNGYRDLPTPEAENDWKVQRLNSTPQDWSGDPQAGLDYLLYGDYIGTGIPFEWLNKRMKGFQDTVLARKGNGGKLPYVYNAFQAANGVEVVAGNCFTCHAGMLNGELVLGLGNSFSDYRNSLKGVSTLTNVLVKSAYGKGTPERAAFEDFGYFYKTIAPNIITQNPGVNPAFRLEEACAQHRLPGDLKRNKKEQFETITYTLASDVPPLWNIDKKNALYYNAMGRGDYAKLLMQASVLGIPDSTQARDVLFQFRDVVAWAAALEPPAFPGPIQEELATLGEAVFTENCSGCHGTYGANESYPNKLVALEKVGTDPLYARYFTTQSGLADWYNQSWFGQSDPKSQLLPSDGYIAPPLDGIWATAPYLHNGSVPTIEALLNSSIRPTYWERSGNSQDYNYQALGWRYTEPDKPKGEWTYDTTLPGYGNQGHTFGDKLSQEERVAVIEYLKTL
jgi:mono/diheme cytochrome c family protein